MSEEQLKAFIEKVKADTSLQEKLKAAANADAVTAIAKEAGFAITAEDIQSKLSDAELERASGGGAYDPVSTSSYDRCCNSPECCFDTH